MINGSNFPEEKFRILLDRGIQDPSYYRENIDKIRKQYGDGSREYALFLGEMALSERRKGEIKEALRLQTQALILVRMHTSFPEDIALIYSYLSFIYLDEGKVGEVLYCLERAVEYFEEVSEIRESRHLIAINNLCGLLYESCEFERASILQEKAAEYAEIIMGETEEYCSIQYNLFLIYLSLGDTVRASFVEKRLVDLYGIIREADSEKKEKFRQRLEAVLRETELLKERI